MFKPALAKPGCPCWVSLKIMWISTTCTYIYICMYNIHTLYNGMTPIKELLSISTLSHSLLNARGSVRPCVPGPVSTVSKPPREEVVLSIACEWTSECQRHRSAFACCRLRLGASGSLPISCSRGSIPSRAKLWSRWTVGTRGQEVWPIVAGHFEEFSAVDCRVSSGQIITKKSGIPNEPFFQAIREV